MKQIFILSFINLSCFLLSQNSVSNYPKNQNPYKGGNTELFKEINYILIKNNEKPCEKNEFFWSTLKIDETGKLYLIKKESDQINADNNKCAYEMLVRVLGNLKNWQPAEIEGKKVSAFFDFPFIPNDYLDNFKENYDITQNINRASFPGGNNEFCKEVNKNLRAYFEREVYKPKGKFVIFLNIDENGKIENVEVDQKKEYNKLFYDDLKFAIKRVKGKWEPAKINGLIVKSKYRFTYDFGDYE